MSVLITTPLYFMKNLCWILTYLMKFQPFKPRLSVENFTTQASFQIIFELSLQTIYSNKNEPDVFYFNNNKPLSGNKDYDSHC